MSSRAGRYKQVKRHSMKLFTYLLCLFTASVIYSQREYNFDCEVQYQVKSKFRNLDYTRTYYINTKDNSYFAVKVPVEKSKYKLQIIDYEGLIAKQTFNADQLNKSTVILKSDNAKFYSNPYKYQIDNYDFKKHSDTIVDGKQLNNIILASTNSKTNRKKRIGHYKYLVDPEFQMLPMFEFSTAYEIFKARKNFPKGLITQFYMYDSKNEMGTSQILKGFIFRDFKILFSN